jgi:hypothetical protein
MGTVDARHVKEVIVAGHDFDARAGVRVRIMQRGGDDVQRSWPGPLVDGILRRGTIHHYQQWAMPTRGDDEDASASGDTSLAAHGSFT